MSALPQAASDRAAAQAVPGREAPPLQRARGDVRLGFRRRGDASVLSDLYQAGCGRARLPRTAAGAPPEAVLLNTAGGLTDGDRMHIAVRLEPAAEAVVTTQAAEKIYRSRGGDSRIDTRLVLSPSAALAWLPQETILFDAAQLARRTEVELADDCRLLACEALVFGRAAHGERMRRGRLLDTWRVRRGGRLIWADGLRLEGDIAATLARPAVFGGARCCATLLYAADDAEARLPALRATLADSGLRAGASQCDGLLVARLLAEDTLELRAALAAACGLLRAAPGAAPLPMPRVWTC